MIGFPCFMMRYLLPDFSGRAKCLHFALLFYTLFAFAGFFVVIFNNFIFKQEDPLGIKPSDLRQLALNEQSAARWSENANSHPKIVAKFGSTDDKTWEKGYDGLLWSPGTTGSAKAGGADAEDYLLSYTVTRATADMAQIEQNKLDKKPELEDVLFTGREEYEWKWGGINRRAGHTRRHYLKDTQPFVYKKERDALFAALAPPAQDGTAAAVVVPTWVSTVGRMATVDAAEEWVKKEHPNDGATFDAAKQKAAEAAAEEKETEAHAISEDKDWKKLYQDQLRYSWNLKKNVQNERLERTTSPATATAATLQETQQLATAATQQESATQTPATEAA